MTSDEIQKLASKILHHKKLYYNGEPEISDQAYDQLEDRLRELDPEHPVLHIVGTPDSGKVRHSPPMLSAQKATELDTVVKWAQDSTVQEFTAGYKVDGLSVSLIYRDGRLIQAATRGNGDTGDDVTLECMKIRTIPQTIEVKPDVNIRGEVYMKISEFHRVNRNLPDDEKYSSPRNLATGTLKQKNLDILDRRSLDFLAWQLIGHGEDLTIMEQMELMQSWGFEIADRDFLDHPTREDFDQLFQHYVEEREDLDFEIDGVIFKYNQPQDREQAGYTEHHPKWSMAWKFQSKGEITKVEDIIWQVGRTGVLTPVAKVLPVDVAGATISKATLHNAEMVETLNVAPGDQVALVRAGDVIPQILDVVDKGENSVSLPSKCPSCGSDLKRESVELVCTGEECRERDIQQIAYWVQQTEIKGLGEKSIEKLYDQGLVHHYADLYELSQHQLVDLLGKNGEKIYQEIEESRTLTLSTFLAALGIKNLGPKMGKILAQEFNSYEDLQHASKSQLTQLEGISDLTADYILQGVNNPNTGDRVLEHDITIISRKQAKKQRLLENDRLQNWFDGDTGNTEQLLDELFDPKYGGKKIYVTGSVDGFTKKEIKEQLELRGIEWHTTVSSNLDFLVYGARAGQSKLDDADKKGVEKIAWEEFNGQLKRPLEAET
jgi:DNA ligase (NAD+)